MLSELLRKEYKVKKPLYEVETADYQDIKDHLTDNFNDLNDEEIMLTRFNIRYHDSNTEDYIERVIKDCAYLVYYTNVMNENAVMVYFDGNFRNELITKHNEKVLTFIKKVEEITKDLDLRYKLVNANENLVKKELELGNMYPNTYTMDLTNLLNDLVAKTNYIFGDTLEERTNTVLYTDPDFNKVSWSLAKRKAFMLSLFSDLPIGHIYRNAFDYSMLSDDSDELLEFDRINNIIYDGKNRLSTVFYFLIGGFSVDFNGETYSAGNINKETLNKLLRKKITIYETDFQTKEELLAFYNMLNVND